MVRLVHSKIGVADCRASLLLKCALATSIASGLDVYLQHHIALQGEALPNDPRACDGTLVACSLCLRQTPSD